MKKITFVALLVAAPLSFAAQAQDTAAVPSLADVMGGMSDAEVSTMENDTANAGSLSLDMDGTIEAAVSEAIADGLITADQAEDAAATMELIQANAEFFNFDILDALGEVIESGEFSMDQIRTTLEGFNNLSDAGKALVGNSEFDVADDSDGSLFNQLSDADKAIVASQMPVVADDQ